MFSFRLFAIFFIGVSWLASPVTATNFSEVFFFGDSLSDVGNIAQATFGIQPGDFYFNDRFSNGPVYSEILADQLGFGPLTHSRSGGNNFAHGGAQTSGTGGLNGLFIRDLDEQVTSFVNSRQADPESLFVVFTGSNDLLNGQTDVTIPVDTISTQIARLHGEGARHLLVMNLPGLGATPRFNLDPATAAAMDQLTSQFNVALDAELNELETSLPDLSVRQLDVEGIFAEIIEQPAAFGFENVSDPAAPGLEAGDSSYDESNIVGNPNSYLFWDELHPTTSAHMMLAEHAMALLFEPDLPGDYDLSGVVDATDYSFWLGSLGSTVTPGSGADGNINGVVDVGDFQVWKKNLGSRYNAGKANRTVPEPHTCVLLLVQLLVICLDERRPRR